MYTGKHKNTLPHTHTFQVQPSPCVLLPPEVGWSLVKVGRELTEQSAGGGQGESQKGSRKTHTTHAHMNSTCTNVHACMYVGMYNCMYAHIAPQPPSHTYTHTPFHSSPYLHDNVGGSNYFTCMHARTHMDAHTHAHAHTHLHVLLHSGNIHLIRELELVVVAGVRQHQVVVSAASHQPASVPCSLGEAEGSGGGGGGLTQPLQFHTLPSNTLPRAHTPTHLVGLMNEPSLI